jgi:hypothetical protein
VFAKGVFNGDGSSNSQALANSALEKPRTPSQLEPSSTGGNLQSAQLSPSDQTTPSVQSAQPVLASQLPSGANATVATTASNDQGCAFGGESPEVSPTSAYKPGNYVYLVALVDTTVCLQDGQNKINRLSLTSGSTQTVQGLPPWKVSIKAADEAKIFYQGQRIQPPLPGPGAQVFTLVEYKP